MHVSSECVSRHEQVGTADLMPHSADSAMDRTRILVVGLLLLLLNSQTVWSGTLRDNRAIRAADLPDYGPTRGDLPKEGYTHIQQLASVAEKLQLAPQVINATFNATFNETYGALSRRKWLIRQGTTKGPLASSHTINTVI